MICGDAERGTVGLRLKLESLEGWVQALSLFRSAGEVCMVPTSNREV